MVKLALVVPEDRGTSFIPLMGKSRDIKKRQTTFTLCEHRLWPLWSLDRHLQVLLAQLLSLYSFPTGWTHQKETLGSSTPESHFALHNTQNV